MQQHYLCKAIENTSIVLLEGTKEGQQVCLPGYQQLKWDTEGIFQVTPEHRGVGTLESCVSDNKDISLMAPSEPPLAQLCGAPIHCATGDQ